MQKMFLFIISTSFAFSTSCSDEKKERRFQNYIADRPQSKKKCEKLQKCLLPHNDESVCLQVSKGCFYTLIISGVLIGIVTGSLQAYKYGNSLHPPINNGTNTYQLTHNFNPDSSPFIHSSKHIYDTALNATATHPIHLHRLLRPLKNKFAHHLHVKAQSPYFHNLKKEKRYFQPMPRTYNKKRNIKK